MGFAAEFAGFCPACSAKYAAGTQITKGASGWIHVSCPVAGASASSSTPASKGSRLTGSTRTVRQQIWGARRGMGAGHGAGAPVHGYSSYCTDNAACRCYDCAS